MVLVAAALPWAHWMVFPVLAATVLSLLVFGVVYLKKVLEPRLLYLDQLQLIQLDQSAERSNTHGHVGAYCRQPQGPMTSAA